MRHCRRRSAGVANGKRAGDVAAAAVVGVGHEVEAFVDRTVAVVVEAVAGLDAGVGARALAAVHIVAVGVVEVGEAGLAALAVDARRSRFGTRHDLKQVPQFEMSVCRSGELLSHIVLPPLPPTAPPPVPALAPAPPRPADPPWPPALPAKPPKPPRPPPASGRPASTTPPSGGISWTPKSQTRSLHPEMPTTANHSDPIRLRVRHPENM